MSFKKLAFSLSMLVIAANAFASERTGRRLASVSPGSSLATGQGENMLRNLRRPAPGFLGSSADSRRGRFTVQGVCRDSYNIAHLSTEKSYADCLEATNNRSGASVHDYFGPAQRQTGAAFGFRVGN